MNSINLIVLAIATALDLKFEASSELSKQLRKYLRPKWIFLILENLEQLLDGESFLNPLH